MSYEIRVILEPHLLWGVHTGQKWRLFFLRSGLPNSVTTTTMNTSKSVQHVEHGPLSSLADSWLDSHFKPSFCLGIYKNNKEGQKIKQVKILRKEREGGVELQSRNIEKEEREGKAAHRIFLVLAFSAFDKKWIEIYEWMPSLPTQLPSSPLSFSA